MPHLPLFKNAHKDLKENKIIFFHDSHWNVTDIIWANFFHTNQDFESMLWSQLKIVITIFYNFISIHQTFWNCPCLDDHTKRTTFYCWLEASMIINVSVFVFWEIENIFYALKSKRLKVENYKLKLYKKCCQTILSHAAI